MPGTLPLRTVSCGVDGFGITLSLVQPDWLDAGDEVNPFIRCFVDSPGSSGYRFAFLFGRLRSEGGLFARCRSRSEINETGSLTSFYVPAKDVGVDGGR